MKNGKVYDIFYCELAWGSVNDLWPIGSVKLDPNSPDEAILRAIGRALGESAQVWKKWQIDVIGDDVLFFINDENGEPLLQLHQRLN